MGCVLILLALAAYIAIGSVLVALWAVSPAIGFIVLMLILIPLLVIK